jgi:PAS domain S-box-containing protein
MGEVSERKGGAEERLRQLLGDITGQLREALHSRKEVESVDDDPSLRALVAAANELILAVAGSQARAETALREHEALDRSLGELEDRLAREIDEHEKTASDLSQQRSVLRHVVESLPYCIFWRDRNGVYLGANQNKLRALGLESLDQLVGKTAYETGVSKEEADFYRQIDEQVMATGEPIFNLEEVQQRPDGPHRLLISKVPLRDEGGTVIGIVGMYVDVTRRARIAPRAAAREPVPPLQQRTG